MFHWIHKEIPQRLAGRGKRVLALSLLCCALVSGGQVAQGENGLLLGSEDLQKLEQAYDAFLQQLADLIIARGLLDTEDREEWLEFQWGDFYQNGGYGTISAMFSPNILELARPEDKMLRLQKELPIGTLQVDTMSGYSPLDSALPGLFLEAVVTDSQGLPLVCRFRWHSAQGGFSTWDAMDGKVADVGNTYINDGRPAYWSDQPVTAARANAAWSIQVEILDPYDDAVVLGSAELVLTPNGSGWILLGDALR